MAKEQQRPGYRDILAASHRISAHVINTPVMHTPALNQRLAINAWYKCENLQHTGAFKFRGASNAILRLREKGITENVATQSSGNHGAAVIVRAHI